GVDAAKRAPAYELIGLLGNRGDAGADLRIGWRHANLRVGLQSEHRAIAPELELLFSLALPRVGLLDFGDGHFESDLRALPRGRKTKGEIAAWCFEGRNTDRDGHG